MPQIAKKLGIKTRTVETVLKKLRIGKNWGERILSSEEGYRDKHVLTELIQQGLNASQIAKRFNVHARTITHWLKKFNIPYSKALGYSRMNRNPVLRREMKKARAVEAEKARTKKLKYPARGKGHAVSKETKQKLSLTSTFFARKPATPEEKLVAKIIKSMNLTAEREIPLAFFDDDRFCAAYRVDFFFPRGELHEFFPVVLHVDSAWHHIGIQVNKKRDQAFNVYAVKSGMIVLRVWSQEIELGDEAKTLKHLNLLLKKAKTVSPGLLRYACKIFPPRTVTYSNENLEYKTEYSGLRSFKFVPITEANIEEMKHGIGLDKKR